MPASAGVQLLTYRGSNSHTFNLLAKVNILPNNPAGYLLLQPGCVVAQWLSHLCETPERSSSLAGCGVSWMMK